MSGPYKTFEELKASIRSPRIPWRRWLYTLRWKPRETWRGLTEFFIRGRRGWAPSDTWNLDGYLTRVIGESLAHLAETTYGWPGTEEWATFEDWQRELRNHSAILLAAVDPDLWQLGWEEEDRRRKAAQASLKRLSEFWGHLWS